MKYLALACLAGLLAGRFGGPATRAYSAVHDDVTSHFDTRLALLAGTSVYLAHVLWYIAGFYSKISAVGHIKAGNYYWYTPFASIPALVLPKIPYITPALFRGNVDPEVHIAECYGPDGKATIRKIVSASPPRINLQIRDPVTIKAIVADRDRFPKDLELYMAIKMFGPSLIISEGDAFRRHRRIVASAFAGDRPNRLDWQESTKAVNAWMGDLEKRANSNGISTEQDVIKLCAQLGLYVICSVAFGVEVPLPGRTAEGPPPAGHAHHFGETVEGAINNLLIAVVTPNLLKRYPPIKAMKEAAYYVEGLNKWMRVVVDQRREATAQGKEPRNDLLSLLVASNDAQHTVAEESGEQGKDEAKGTLDDKELIGNIWLFLFAGHDTSKNALIYILGMLALYPAEQDALFSEIIDISPDVDADIPYELYPQFHRAQAVINETLRMWPIVINVPKMVNAHEDVVLPVSEREGQDGSPIAVPRETRLMLDVLGMHHDPAIWGDPGTFRPDRFIDTDDYKWPRDAFIAFSAGARGCTGQAFARVTLVCVLVHLVRRYKIMLHPDDVRSDETAQQTQKRVLKSITTFTLSPLSLRLQFQKR